MSTAIADAAEGPGIIGHNNPPTFAELLAQQTKPLVAEIDHLVRLADDCPAKVKGPADVETMGKVVLASRALRKVVEERRVVDKNPHLIAGETVDDHYRPLKMRLEETEKRLMLRVTTYQTAERQKETLRQQEEARKAAAAAEAAREKARLAEEAGKHAAAARANQAAANAEAKAQLAIEPVEPTRTTFAGGMATTVKKYDFQITDSNAIPLDDLRPYFSLSAIEVAVRAYVRAHKDSRPLAGVRIFEDMRAQFRS